MGCDAPQLYALEQTVNSVIHIEVLMHFNGADRQLCPESGERNGSGRQVILTTFFDGLCVMYHKFMPYNKQLILFFILKF